MKDRRILQLKPAGSLSRRMATMSSIALVALSSSAIAADYESEQRGQQQSSQWQTEQHRPQRQGQQQWPSESRDYSSEEFQSQQDQASPYEREQQSGSRMRSYRTEERFGRPSQRDRELFEGVSEAFGEDWPSEQQEQFSQDQPQRPRRQWQESGRAMEQQRASGEVINLGIVKLVGLSQPHVIAKIEREDGRKVIADLGPVNKLTQLEIEPGDRLTVIGVRGRLNERP